MQPVQLPDGVTGETLQSVWLPDGVTGETMQPVRLPDGVIGNNAASMMALLDSVAGKK